MNKIIYNSYGTISFNCKQNVTAKTVTFGTLTRDVRDLDTEQNDLILERVSERVKIPVEDDLVPVQLEANLARRNALVSDVEGDSLLDVALHVRDLD